MNEFINFVKDCYEGFELLFGLVYIVVVGEIYDDMEDRGLLFVDIIVFWLRN